MRITPDTSVLVAAVRSRNGASLQLVSMLPSREFEIAFTVTLWEQLKKARRGQWSIRINDQWRVCFEWREGHAWRVEIVDYH